MFKPATIKTKLLILVFILTVIMLLLGGMLTFSYYSNIVSLNKLNKKIILSSRISDTLHSLQKERGLSCGYVLNENKKFKKELLLQRKQSDINIKNIKIFLNNISCIECKSSINKLFFLISKLKNIREKIDNHKLSYNDTIQQPMIPC